MLQFGIVTFILKPFITTWGATSEEIILPMVGDNKQQKIISTRAILINAPKSTVWKSLIQLGADRSGFYSYTFIEKWLGYQTRNENTSVPKFTQLKVGDVIRGSITEEKSLIPYNFKVMYVKPETTFVLQNWGTFLLKKVSDHQTRLIIRTQEPFPTNLLFKVGSHILLPLHYIMERRMLIGIKIAVEKPKNIIYTKNNDLIWFLGAVISWVFICIIIFIERGFVKSLCIPIFFSVCWLLVVLLFNPILIYSAVLLLSIILSFLLLRIKSRR